MHIAPCTNASSSMSGTKSCISAISASESSRASTARQAPMSRQNFTAYLFVMLACVEM